jgi:hypothetical protein
MILTTVGTQLPFDRLIKAMDSFAEKHTEEEYFAQIGVGSFVPSHMTIFREMTPLGFRQACENARIIVSHAGTGNILLALELQKPIIVMPRRAALGEHRNDHQLATVHWMKDKSGIVVAESEAALHAALASSASLVQKHIVTDRASDQLLTTIRDFINVDTKR